MIIDDLEVVVDGARIEVWGPKEAFPILELTPDAAVRLAMDLERAVRDIAWGSK